MAVEKAATSGRSWGLTKLNMDAVAAGSDAELMLRVKEGDEGSFGNLLARYRDPVVNFLYRMVQNAAIAEELAQDVFLRVYRARESYAPSAKSTTWLYCIATNVAFGRQEGPAVTLYRPQAQSERYGSRHRMRSPDQNV